jgi:hypothetical protein
MLTKSLESRDDAAPAPLILTVRHPTRVVVSLCALGLLEGDDDTESLERDIESSITFRCLLLRKQATARSLFFEVIVMNLQHNQSELTGSATSRVHSVLVSGVRGWVDSKAVNLTNGSIPKLTYFHQNPPAGSGRAKPEIQKLTFKFRPRVFDDRSGKLIY